jgi:hypothetical protein
VADIAIDDNYLNKVQSKLLALSQDVVAAPGGTLPDVVLKVGGPNFPTGVSLKSHFNTVATGVDTALTTLGTTMTTRSGQLRLFAATTDQTESLNDMSAADFESHIPGWGPNNTPNTTPNTNPGTNPPTTPPPTTPPPPKPKPA